MNIVLDCIALVINSIKVPVGFSFYPTAQPAEISSLDIMSLFAIILLLIVSSVRICY